MSKKNKKNNKPILNKITLNEYLSNYNRNRNLDGIFKKWFFKKDRSNPIKTKEEWDILIKKFFTETEL